jgi:hypothetical protein
MPLERESSKRKISVSDDEGESSQSTKKAKLPPTSEDAQPTNKVLPVNITFPPRIPGTLRLATWNICGLAASQKKVYPNGLSRFSSNTVLKETTAVRGSRTTWKQKILTFWF